MELTCTQLWCVQSYFDMFGYSEAEYEHVWWRPHHYYYVYKNESLSLPFFDLK